MKLDFNILVTQKAKCAALSWLSWLVKRDFFSSWSQGFFDVVAEPEGYEMELVHGSLPADLEGTFYRNGPGQFHVGDVAVDHPYDGDGVVASVSFHNGRAVYRSRFVETPEYLAEQNSKEVLFRGTFRTQRPLQRDNFLDLYIKNVANTSVQLVGDKLWACFEGSQSTILDAHTLERQGLETLKGSIPMGLPFTLGSNVLNAIASFFLRLAGSGRGVSQQCAQVGGLAMSAHPHWDAARKQWCTFGYQMAPNLKLDMDTRLQFFELDSDGELVDTCNLTVPYYAFLHDFAFTENYYVLWLNPVKVNYVDYMSGKCCAAAAVSARVGRAATVVLMPRPGCSAAVAAAGPVHIEATDAFVFHHCNAYERADGTVVLDSVHYPSYPSVCAPETDTALDVDVGYKATLRRSALDPRARTCTVRDLAPQYFEMPSVRGTLFGRRHRYIYGFHSRFSECCTAVARLDTATGAFCQFSFGPHTYAGEPVFVPRTGASAEDAGYLLCQVLDTHSHAGYIAVLDAEDIEAGAVAVLRMRNPMPHSLHCSFVPEVSGA